MTCPAGSTCRSYQGLNGEAYACVPNTCACCPSNRCSNSPAAGRCVTLVDGTVIKAQIAGDASCDPDFISIGGSTAVYPCVVDSDCTTHCPAGATCGCGAGVAL